MIFYHPSQRIRQRIRLDSYRNAIGFICEFLEPTKSYRIPGCGPKFGSLVLESDRILVSKFAGTYRRF